MDILYILGKYSTWDNNELRYSLRSIEKNGINVDNVYVVGFNPGFLSDKVTYIPHKDKYNYAGKHKNIFNAICYAIENSDISDKFLLSSDDHFYVKPTDFNNYPYYCRRELPNEYTTSHPNKIYCKSLIDTRKILECNGYTYFNFAFHGNTHCSKEGINEVKQLIAEYGDSKYGYEPTCMVLNVLYKETKFPITYRKDLKLYNHHTVDDLMLKIEDREVFSTTNNMDESIKQYLEETFSEKSIYEL